PLRNLISRSPWPSRLFLIPLTLALFAFAPASRAVSPAPDGGYPDFNTAEGDDALFSLTTGVGNAAIGAEALFSNTTGTFNTATGVGALLNNTTASNNTATGAGALFSNTTIGVTTGHDNTATGDSALGSATGSNNIALGSVAGFNLTTGSDNIDIGNVGVAAESNTIRIGTGQTKTFIAGINGVNEGSPTAVFINTTTGQL